MSETNFLNQREDIKTDIVLIRNYFIANSQCDMAVH